MEERDWWNYGINPITGLPAENRSDRIAEEKKYHMTSLSFGHKIKTE